MNKLIASIVMFLGGLAGVLSLLFIASSYNNTRYTSLAAMATANNNSWALLSLKPNILDNLKSLGLYQLGVLFFTIMVIGLVYLIINSFYSFAKKN